MMNFRTIKASIITILENGANNCFTVVGQQRQAKGAEEALGLKRMVQVYWSSGDFPKSSGRIRGGVQLDSTFRIDLFVASQAEGQLSILKNPNARSSEKQVALESFLEASAVADESFDELVELVYQILMGATNFDMGQAKGVVSNRWVDNVQKDQPVPNGEFLLLTGKMFLTLRTPEAITGVTPITGGNIQNITIDYDGDDIERTGRIVNS